MALRLIVNTEFGIQADYIKIGAVVTDYATNQTTVTLLVYANQGARQQGAKALGSNTIIFLNEDFVPDETRATLYPKIKARPEFSAAVDVLDK